MRNLSINSYLVDEDGNYVLDETGGKIILSSGDYEYDESYTRVGTGLGPRVPGIHSFDTLLGLSANNVEEWYLRINKTMFVGRYKTREAALGVLVGLLRRNSATSSDVKLSEILSHRLSTGSSIEANNTITDWESIDMTALLVNAENKLIQALAPSTYITSAVAQWDGASGDDTRTVTINPTAAAELTAAEFVAGSKGFQWTMSNGETGFLSSYYAQVDPSGNGIIWNNSGGAYEFVEALNTTGVTTVAIELVTGGIARPMPADILMTMDNSYGDNFFTLGDGTVAVASGENAIFNPEPDNYFGRTQALAINDGALGNTAPYYFTVFESEAEMVDNTDPNNPRVIIDALIANIQQKLDDGEYYGLTSLEGEWLQIDIEGGNIITIIEQAGMYWNYGHTYGITSGPNANPFDRDPWYNLRSDFINAMNQIRETFGCYVTWYACPRLGNSLSWTFPSDFSPGGFAVPFDRQDNEVANNSMSKATGEYSYTMATQGGIVPDETWTGDVNVGSRAEAIKANIKQNFTDAFTPVIHAMDACHVRYYVNTGAPFDQVVPLLPSQNPVFYPFWTQQKDAAVWAKEIAAPLSIPVMPTTSHWTVTESSELSGKGRSEFKLYATTETSTSIFVYKDDVEQAVTTGYTLAVTGVDTDAVTTVTIVSPDPDAVYRVCWKYLSSDPESVPSFVAYNANSIQNSYDARNVPFSTFDNRVIRQLIEADIDGIFWWTAGGSFLERSLNPVATDWDTVVKDWRPIYGDWRWWNDLNYVTNGYLFDGDTNAEDPESFFDAGLNDGATRTKWANLLVGYVNSHYATPLAEGLRLGAIQPRVWTTADLTSSGALASWDAEGMPIECFFQSTILTEQSTRFRLDLNCISGQAASDLMVLRPLSKIRVTESNGTVTVFDINDFITTNDARVRLQIQKTQIASLNNAKIELLDWYPSGADEVSGANYWNWDRTPPVAVTTEDYAINNIANIFYNSVSIGTNLSTIFGITAINAATVTGGGPNVQITFASNGDASAFAPTAFSVEGVALSGGTVVSSIITFTGAQATDVVNGLIAADAAGQDATVDWTV